MLYMKCGTAIHSHRLLPTSYLLIDYPALLSLFRMAPAALLALSSFIFLYPWTTKLATESGNDSVGSGIV